MRGALGYIERLARRVGVSEPALNVAGGYVRLRPVHIVLA
jgi:hypothetical protein